jgi:amidophosphoribosyltransferase
LHEACGVFGVYAPGQDVARLTFFALFALQHRGQESAGIATANGTGFQVYANMGLVSQVFDEATLKRLKGNIAIGHNRYSTTGSSHLINAQPFLMAFTRNAFAFAFNGNIPNYGELREKLMSRGHTFTAESEMELVGMLYSIALNKKDNIYDASREVMGQLDGAYNLLFLDGDGNLYAARDPQGFKPFVVGKDAKGNVFFSSESCALEALGVRRFRDLKPGEVLKVSKEKGLHGKQAVEPRHITHCMFEFLYFARADSVIEGRLNNEVRKKLGEALARMHPVEADYVVPVPDSGRNFALGYSRASGIPYEEGLMKNRYIFRTFIMPEQELREKAVRAKLNPVRQIIDGKRIVLVEDSIVRGTTLKAIVQLLRNAGAREVHVRVGCPPVIAPCYMGMDFPTYKELAAANYSIEEIRRMIGADTLGYTDLKALEEAIGLDGKLCMACLTDKYPLKHTPKKGTPITCC